MTPCDNYPFCDHADCERFWFEETKAPATNNNDSAGYEACGLFFTWEDYSAGLVRLHRAGVNHDDIAAAIEADQELAEYAIGTAGGPCLKTSIATLRRLAQGPA